MQVLTVFGTLVLDLQIASCFVKLRVGLICKDKALDYDSFSQDILVFHWPHSQEVALQFSVT